MAQAEHPMDVPRTIDDAGGDVVAAAEITDDRNPLECSVLFVEALPGAEIHLRDASVPVEIGAFGLDEMLDDGVDSVGAELDGQVADELREAVECGVRMGVKRGHLNLQGWCLLIEDRSEEHTSELQSLMRISYAVFCLKKNTHKR